MPKNVILPSYSHHLFLLLLTKLPQISSNALSMSFLSHSSSHHRSLAVTRSLVILLLLFGDIHPYPDPRTNTYKVRTLNICTLLNPLKFPAVSDLAESRHIDLFALAEMWMTSSSTRAELFNATPVFTFISCPRPRPTIFTKYRVVGGGAAFHIREPAIPFYLLVSMKRK